jgi:hypothetical protein
MSGISLILCACFLLWHTSCVGVKCLQCPSVCPLQYCNCFYLSSRAASQCVFCGSEIREWFCPIKVSLARASGVRKLICRSVGWSAIWLTLLITSLFFPTELGKIYTVESGTSLVFQLCFCLSLTYGHKTCYLTPRFASECLLCTASEWPCLLTMQK